MNISRKTKNNTSLIILVVFISSNIFSQSLKGTIKNSNGEKIAFANVVLYKDSIFIKGTIADSGNYVFNNLPLSDYKITYSCMGYLDTNFVVNHISKNTIVDIVLRENTILLNEITINGNIPLFEMKENKMVMNVGATPLKNEESVGSLMRYIPGVVSTQNGIEVFGKGAPLIMINGKNAQASQLSSLKPEDIKSIETSNSAAQYDASTQVIINIVTKRKMENVGLNIYNRTTYQREMFTNNTKINLNISKKKFNHSLLYQYHTGKTPSEEISENKLSITEKPFNTKFSVNSTEKDNTHNLYYGLNCDINSKNSIGVQLNGNYSTPKLTNNILSTTNSETYKNNMSSDATSKNAGINLSYDLKPDSTSSLSILSDLYTYDKSGTTTIEENSNVSLQKSSSKFNIYALQADYSKYLSKYKSKLLFGGKIYNTTNKNSNSFSTKLTNDSIIENQLFTNSSNLDEKLLSAYTSINKSFSKKTNLNIGVRYENYNRSLTIKDSCISQIDNFFFPSASLGYNISEQSSLLLNYSANINRQSYDNISQENIYVNPYLYRVGNPNLKPEVTNSISMTYSNSNFLQFAIDYKSRNNYSTMFFRNNDSVIIVFIDNCKKQDLNFMLNLSIQNQKSYTSLGINANKPFFSYEYLGQKVSVNKLNFSLSFENTYFFTKNTKSSVSIQYNPKSQMDMYVLDPTLQIEAGFLQYFYNKKLRFGLFGTYSSIDKYLLQYKNLEINHSFEKNRFTVFLSILYDLNLTKWTNTKSSIETEKNRIK